MDDQLTYILLAWLVLAVIIGFWGDTKVIGFFSAFLVTIFTTPLIGLIIVALSKEKKIAFAERKRLQELSVKSSVADELKKLSDLRASGALTNDEYETLKAKELQKQ